MQVTELCPNCGHDQAYSEEKQVSELALHKRSLFDVRSNYQMRSADEGSTILYTVRIYVRHSGGTLITPFMSPIQCVSCRHGWRLNN